MKIAVLCFSQNGWQTGVRLTDGFQDSDVEISLEGKSKHLPNSISEGHKAWTGKHFSSADAIIFIGACGIAVRSIAPFLKSKKTDPAVLVIDECGKFVISLLSGHLGGANELAEKAASILGAVPVITTATDIHNLFAVDVFAKKNYCDILPLKAAKELSAALLSGDTIGFYSDFPMEGVMPDELTKCDRTGFASNGIRPNIGVSVSIDCQCRPFPVTVHVIPRVVTLGIGCRKGKAFEELQKNVKKCLLERGIFQQAVEWMASIELKKEEPGLLQLSKEWKIPFLTFSEKELEKAKGTFTESDFVKSITGIDNVCERSAVIGSGQGRLIQRKIALDGMTIALAVRDWRVHFE